MQKPKQVKKTEKPLKCTPINWLECINDENLRLAIPVGPRFQADVPNWTGSPHKKNHCIAVSKPESSRWLGTKIWSPEDKSPLNKEDAVGKGRPESCTCFYSGSFECIKRHVTKKRVLLQIELGHAFGKWKFNEMGEEVSKLWNQEEQKKFESLVKSNPISEGKGFIKPALECFPSHSRENIVSYYFNVYLTRRMSMQLRSDSMITIVNTDDEEEEVPQSERPKKRTRVNSVSLCSSKFRYLTGRR